MPDDPPIHASEQEAGPPPPAPPATLQVLLMEDQWGARWVAMQVTLYLYPATAQEWGRGLGAAGHDGRSRLLLPPGTVAAMDEHYQGNGHKEVPDGGR